MVSTLIFLAAVISLRSNVNNGALCLRAQSKKYASYAYILACLDIFKALVTLFVKHNVVRCGSGKAICHSLHAICVRLAWAWTNGVIRLHLSFVWHASLEAINNPTILPPFSDLPVL